MRTIFGSLRRNILLAILLPVLTLVFHSRHLRLEGHGYGLVLDPWFVRLYEDRALCSGPLNLVIDRTHFIIGEFGDYVRKPKFSYDPSDKSWYILIPWMWIVCVWVVSWLGMTLLRRRQPARAFPIESSEAVNLATLQAKYSCAVQVVNVLVSGLEESEPLLIAPWLTITTSGAAPTTATRSTQRTK